MPSHHHPIAQKPNKNKLNQAQEAAARAPISPLLIVAGAGTGKTRTLTSRVIHLIEEGVQPERICAITFTNKAAKEMADRIARSGPFIGTFHSLGARILRRECRAFGRAPNFAIFDDHDSFDLIKKIVKGDLDLKKNKRYTPSFFAIKIAEIKNLGGVVQNQKGSEEETELIATTFQKYEGALAENNAFDFDDLIEKPVALFKRDPAVLARYQNLFDAILVDEYQDINPKQYELVKLLAQGHKNLSVVGDDEQTIYTWRYADIKMFLGFDKEWPDAKVHFLEENYRSTGNIIRAASAVAEKNRYRTPKSLWTKNPDGDQIVLFEAWGDNDEAEWVAQAVEGIRGEKTINYGPSGPDKNEKTIAVLYRTNAQSRAIEQALIRRDIPYQIFGGLKFYERREIKDAVAALRWASNNKDTVARERLEKNFSKKKFADFKEKIASAENLTPQGIIKIFLETFDYFDYLESNFINPDEREENIGELISFANEFESLSDLLEKLSLLQATDEIDRKKEGAKKDEKKIALMTIHVAKGLEFDHVFIAGVAEGLLPHIRSIDNELSLEEERRLMYVAMTRAKEKLYISFYGMPSRFLAEIPEDCLALAASVGESVTESD